MSINQIRALFAWAVIGLSTPAFAQTILPNTVPNTFGMGDSVAIDGDTAVLGAPRIANAGVQRGAVMVYTRTSGAWQLQQALQRNVGFGFGDSVDVSGDTLIVGSRSTFDPSAYDAATVYVRSGGTWAFQATLPTAAPSAVAVDGDTALVATGDNTLYVFVRSGSTWTQQARLVMPDRDPADTRVVFGGRPEKIAIDGNTIVVGAPTNNLGGNTELGSAYVFIRSGALWSFQAKLTRGGLRFFGNKVALSGDTVLVGNYVFNRSGTTWVEGAPPAIPGLGSFSVNEDHLPAIDGSTAVIRAYNTSYSFRRIGASWFFQELLRPNDGTPDEWLSTLALSGDTVLAGAPRVGEQRFPNGDLLSNGPGAGYVFQLSALPTGPPGAPVDLRATVSGNTIGLQWATPTTGGAASSYELFGRLVAGGPVVATLPMGAGTSFNVAAPNGTFVVTVRAANVIGTGPESAPVTVTVPQAMPPPGPPSNLVATVSGTTVGFTWSPPSSGGPVASYLLVAGLTPAFSVPYVTAPLGPAPGAVVPGVPAGTYYVRVLAQNAGGTSAASNEVSLTVAGLVTPGAPTLQASVSGSTVSLSWSAGAGGPPASYTLTASVTPGGAPIATVPLTGTSATFAGVPSGTYYLRVTATNTAGTSPPSPSLAVTVP